MVLLCRGRGAAKRGAATQSSDVRIRYVGSIQGDGERGGNGHRETAVDESRKETADRSARYQAD